MGKHQVGWVYKYCEKHIIIKMNNQAQYRIHQNMKHKWIMKLIEIIIKHENHNQTWKSSQWFKTSTAYVCHVQTKVYIYIPNMKSPQ